MAHLSHGYNTRNNSSISPIAEEQSSETISNDSEISETAMLIKNLEKNMNSRFDGLDKEIINLKEVIIKNLQIENERLRKKVDDLENKIEIIDRDHKH